MADKWKLKEPENSDEKKGPYTHWWETKEKEFLPPEIKSVLSNSTFNLGRAAPSRYDEATKVADALYDSGKAVPLPRSFGNPKKHKDWLYEQVEPNLPDDIPTDTVITGILDTGIALSHMMTNMKVGKTRFIASWQQGTPMTTKNKDPDSRAQDWLPCGQEVYERDINDALKQFGDSTGVVDEEAFIRSIGSSTSDIFGNRDLEMAAAHGTHTLSLAAGIDPTLHSDEDLQRQRIIAVNLPAQYSHGSGGNFLAYFAVYGVERILHLADALWKKNTKDKETQKAGFRGYPVVINFSYGMVAGPKDGYHVFENAFRQIVRARDFDAKDDGFALGASPVRIAMPIGNDNLKRGAASSLLGQKEAKHKSKHDPDQRITLPWRIQPGDSTANFLEVWVEGTDQASFNESLLKHLKVSITPPGKTDCKLEKLLDGSFQDLGDYARVYSQHVKIGPFPVTKGTKNPANKEIEPDGIFEYRLALLVCIAPTTHDLKNAPTAPAGLWEVKVDYDGPVPLDFTFYVQSDQSAVVTSKTGLRSYFDHQNYRTHLTEHPKQFSAEKTELFRDECGAEADTFSFAVDEKKPYPIDNDDWKTFGPVQRRGTNNALASRYLQEIIAVGGYDDSNGFPAPYSSSTDGNPQGEHLDGSALDMNVTAPQPAQAGRVSMAVLYPAENAPSLYGILGSGARDGSVVGSRGTSMSTALATRRAGQAFLAADPKAAAVLKMIANDAWFRSEAATEEDQENNPKSDTWGQYAKWPGMGQGGFLKMGSGRMPDPRGKGKVRRAGGSD